MALKYAERVPFNIITDMLKVIVVALVGIWVTPYYVKSLGVSAYGLISLAFTVTMYVTVVTNAICGACSRYNVVAIRQNKDISKTMSTSFYGILKLCLFILPIAILIAIIAPFVFNIGDVPPLEVQIMFGFVMIASLISNTYSPFRSVFNSCNSGYYDNLIECCNSIVQVILVVMLFVNNNPSVMYIGISFFCASIISFVLVFYFSRREYSNYELRLNYYDKNLYKEIGNLAKWNIVSAAGSVLFIQASIIIVNIFLGSENSGLFGIISSFVSMVTMATMTITHSFGPFTLRFYAEENIEMMTRVLSSGFKFVSLVIAMPLAYIMVFSPQILTAWVGSDFIHLSKYIFIIAIAFIVHCAVFSLYSVPTAFLSVDKSSKIGIMCGLVNIVLATVLCLTTDLGMTGVVIAYSLSIVLYSLSYAVLCEKLICVKKFHFIRLLLYGIVSLVISYTILSIVDQYITISGDWTSVIISFVVMFVVYMLIVVALLPKNDKNMIEEILTGKLKSTFHNVFNRE